VNRRNLLSFLGLAPIIGASAVLANVRRKDGPDDLKHAQWHLCFTDHDNKKSCAVNVGKDGHLWLKINGKWSRVVTE